MKGLAEGFSAGFNMAEAYKNNTFDREQRSKKDARDAETHATNQDEAGLRIAATRRTNGLNEEYDSAIGANQPGLQGPVQPGQPSVQSAAQAMTATSRVDPMALANASLRAGKSTPEQYDATVKRIRTEKFNTRMGERMNEYLNSDDETMKKAISNFSLDDSTFGQAHWVAGGAPGKPGDPNPRTGKGGYAYVMVGDREPFKLTRAESAKLAAAYEIMNEDPENYDLAFDILDKGSAKMRELGAAFRDEFSRGVKQNNDATHMARVDANASEHLGLAKDRAARDKFGQLVQMIGPDGTPAFVQPVMGRDGASYQQVPLPQGYRLPKQVDPAVLDRMASNMVGQPSGEMVNGKAVPHTYESAYSAAHARLSGQQTQGNGPDIAGDAAAIRGAMNQQPAPQARPQAGLAPQARPAMGQPDRLRQMVTNPQQGGPTRSGQEQIIGPDGRVYFRPVDDGVDPQARLLGIMR